MIFCNYQYLLLIFAGMAVQKSIKSKMILAILFFTFNRRKVYLKSRNVKHLTYHIQEYESS